MVRAGTPLNGSVIGNGAATPTTATPTSGHFEGALLKNRSLGQDILPSPGQPKRTESLYVTPARGSVASGGSGGGTGIKVSPVYIFFYFYSFYSYRLYLHTINAIRSLHYTCIISREFILQDPVTKNCLRSDFCNSKFFLVILVWFLHL